MNENTTDIVTTVTEAVSKLTGTEASSEEITETARVSIQEQVTRTATILERALDHLKKRRTVLADGCFGADNRRYNIAADRRSCQTDNETLQY